MSNLPKYIIAFVLSICNIATFAASNTVMKLSVSSDGQYAISTNSNRHAYLWNLKNKTYKELSTYPVNVYSAFFVPDSNNFMIQQDKTNEVIIENTGGKIIKKFNPGFVTYGQAINDKLTQYVASDKDYNSYLYSLSNMKKKQILVGWCIGDHGGKHFKGKLPAECSGFMLNGKSLEFKFIKDSTKLIGTTGYFYVYNLGKMNWERYPTGGSAMSAISPNGDYVYTADQQYGGIRYNLGSGQLKYNGFYYPDEIANISYSTANNNKESYFNGITDFRFIASDKIITTFRGVTYPYMYAVLFTPSKFNWDAKKPTFHSKKYVPLVKNPQAYSNGQYGKELYPNVTSYNMAFDTSPSAHVLVTGQANGSGIMVYQYDPKDESLKLVWSPVVK